MKKCYKRSKGPASIPAREHVLTWRARDSFEAINIYNHMFSCSENKNPSGEPACIVSNDQNFFLYNSFLVMIDSILNFVAVAWLFSFQNYFLENIQLL